MAAMSPIVATTARGSRAPLARAREEIRWQTGLAAFDRPISPDGYIENPPGTDRPHRPTRDQAPPDRSA